MQIIPARQVTVKRGVQGLVIVTNIPCHAGDPESLIWIIRVPLVIDVRRDSHLQAN